MRDFLHGSGREHGPCKFVDLFCGIGGASAGAAAAGYEVVLAVDSWDTAVACHARNHPDAKHMCIELPPQEPLPLPTDERWHLHGSPPCTNVSIANQNRYEEEREKAVRLVRWFLEFALLSAASSWSMEQVPTPLVMDCVQSFRAAKAPFRNRIDYEIVDFYHHGVPQHRRRLIAGSPEVVARLRRAPRVHRSVSDLVADPRGTHVRNYMRKTNMKPAEIIDGKKVYTYTSFGDDDCCVPVTGPSHVILASTRLRWAVPGKGVPFKLFTTRESAAVQCFPPEYVLPENTREGIRGVGNALPPIVMTRMLARA